jgi:hypothetical protein
MLKNQKSFGTMSIHFPDIKATFIHIPRTGGTSLLHWATSTSIDFDAPKKYKHCTFSEATKLWKTLGTTFTFVRNPYDRMVSLFHYMGQNAKNRVEVWNRGHTPTTLDGIQNSIYNDDIAMSNYYDLGFENWLIDYSNESSSPYNSYTNVRNPEIFNNWYSTPRTINYWIEDSIDIIIKIEELKNKIGLLEEVFNTSIHMSHSNSSTRDNYKNYYNNNTRNIIQTMFKDDLEKYGYEF